jgi:hypothetical protein
VLKCPRRSLSRLRFAQAPSPLRERESEDDASAAYQNNIPRAIDDYPLLVLYSHYPAPTTEGCLYSIFRCGAGSGGRQGASEMRRKFPSRQVQTARSRGKSACLAGARDDARGDNWSRYKPRHRGPTAVVRWLVAKMSRLTMSVHRGPGRANLSNTARGTPKARQFRGD